MQNQFITVPTTTLPDGSTVPEFRVGQYACSQDEDGRAVVTAEGTPWVRINFEEAKAACQAAGFALITERQWLAIAWNVAQQDCNWTGGKAGEGKLFRGIRKCHVDSAQPGTFDPKSKKERRWLALSNGERICDINGNVFQWIFDDVQGTEAGLTGKIAADSISLNAPHPSEEKGMGWRPSGECHWSGNALIRGGYWYSESFAGAFILGSVWPANRSDRVGFRCTQPGL